MLATSLMLTPAGVSVAGEGVYHRPYGDKVNIKVLDRGQKKVSRCKPVHWKVFCCEDGGVASLYPLA